MAEYVQVLTTVGSEEEAAKIGGDLLERRLVACAQTVGPITSRYRWQGKLEEEREWQLLVKTEAGLYEEVEAAIRALHSYEEPEILAIPILAGSKGYLDWIGESVESPETA
jgi:periplasmic divalent cation tolerance protein